MVLTERNLRFARLPSSILRVPGSGRAAQVEKWGKVSRLLADDGATAEDRRAAAAELNRMWMSLVGAGTGTLLVAFLLVPLWIVGSPPHHPFSKVCAVIGVALIGLTGLIGLSGSVLCSALGIAARKGKLRSEVPR